MIVEQTLLSKGRKKIFEIYLKQTNHTRQNEAFYISFSKSISQVKNLMVFQGQTSRKHRKKRIFKIIKMPELDSPNLKFWTETSRGFPTELL